MRHLFTFLFIALFVVAAQAQQAATVPAPSSPPPSPRAPAAIHMEKTYTELISSSEKIVKGMPFSAEAVNESVQTLADGNRIVRSSSTKLFRDSEGRFRREGMVNSGGVYVSSSPITITDPVSGFRYYINDKDRSVRRTPFKAFGELKALTGTLTTATKMHTELGTVYGTAGSAYAATIKPTVEAKVKAELEQAVQGRATIATTINAVPGQFILANDGHGFAATSNTESLGMRDFDGVQAEGTRSTTTIPAGAIGNERAIDIVYEKWYSKDLQMIVYSKHSDPRSGDQTYKLVNLSRNEPEASVFVVPADYKMQAEQAKEGVPFIYKLSTAGSPVPAAAQTGATPSAAGAAAAPAKAPTPKKEQ